MAIERKTKADERQRLILFGLKCKCRHLKKNLRCATGSEIFFSLERRGGGGFQKMVLRKNGAEPFVFY